MDVKDSWDYAETLERKAVVAEEKGLLLGDSACASCKRGMAFRRKGKLDIVSWCHALERVVPSDIAECTYHEPKNTVSLQQMVEMALDVDGRDGIHAKSYL
jgi:hypothetical protein